MDAGDSNPYSPPEVQPAFSQQPPAGSSPDTLHSSLQKLEEQYASAWKSLTVTSFWFSIFVGLSSLMFFTNLQLPQIPGIALVTLAAAMLAVTLFAAYRGDRALPVLKVAAVASIAILVTIVVFAGSARAIFIVLAGLNFALLQQPKVVRDLARQLNERRRAETGDHSNDVASGDH